MRERTDRGPDGRSPHDIAARAEEHGVFPGSSLRVHEVVGRTGSTLHDLEQVVRQDRVLTARLLRSASHSASSDHGRTPRLTDVLLRHGVHKVRDLALALGFARVVVSEQGRSRQLWTHALRSGCIAGSIASDIRSIRQSDAFQAGLLHDYGVLVMMAEGPEDYPELIAETGVTLIGLDALEWERYGFDHAELGDLCLRRMGFSAAVCEAVLQHHSHLGRPLTALVTLACELDTGVSVGLPARASAEEAVNHPANGVLRRSVRQLEQDIRAGERQSKDYLARVGLI